MRAMDRLQCIKWIQWLVKHSLHCIQWGHSMTFHSTIFITVPGPLLRRAAGPAGHAACCYFVAGAGCPCHRPTRHLERAPRVKWIKRVHCSLHPSGPPRGQDMTRVRLILIAGCKSSVFNLDAWFHVSPLSASEFRQGRHHSAPCQRTSRRLPPLLWRTEPLSITVNALGTEHKCSWKTSAVRSNQYNHNVP